MVLAGATPTKGAGWRGFAMPSFTEGSLVRHRPTQSLYAVVRRDEDAAVLLLTPAVNPSTASPPTAIKESPRTRWAFEKMVDLVDKTKSPATSAAAAAAAPAADTAAAPTKNAAKPSTLDPTPYARRTAKLDRRVEFRRCPERGRGLFALRDIPRGTEVMRVRAAGAVLAGHAAKDSCAGCFLNVTDVSQLGACRGCPLRFCARCKKYGVGASGGGAGHNSGTCELTREILFMGTANRGSSRSPSEGLLRLVADLFVRRKAGVISDEEWDLVLSLESHENEAGSMRLATSELQKYARLLKSLVGVEVSHQDLQAMYRRVARNVHTVSPNATAIELSASSVEGLFPFGALVNHSCLPNSCFHCVLEASSSVDGPLVMEQVLRTTRKVRAGEELCYSYLNEFSTAGSVWQRRELLEGWGFRCACKRCQHEDEEETRLKTHPTPIDRVGLEIVRRLERIELVWQRQAQALKEEEFAPTLEEIAQFLVAERERRLSPLLANMIAIALYEVTVMVGVSNPLFLFSASGFAAEAYSRLDNPAEVALRVKQHTHSKNVEGCEGFSASPEQLKHVKAVGVDALEQALRLHELFYGEEHKLSISLRRYVEGGDRRSR